MQRKCECKTYTQYVFFSNGLVRDKPSSLREALTGGPQRVTEGPQGLCLEDSATE